MRISDWSSDVCSSDLAAPVAVGHVTAGAVDQAPAHQDVKVETKQERQHKTVDHAVKPGESLWSIAEDHFGDGARYKELVELNRDLLGEQPSFLEPGWVLKLPAPQAKDAPARSEEHTSELQSLMRISYAV